MFFNFDFFHYQLMALKNISKGLFFHCTSGLFLLQFKYEKNKYKVLRGCK